MSGPFQGGTAAALVDVVVVSYESRDLTVAALDSLAATDDVPLDVVVVDNASVDGTAAAIRARHPRARLILNAENRGFAAACNQGWRSGAAPFVLFLNPDAEVLPGALRALVEALESRPQAGVCGPRTLNEDGTVQVSTGEDLTLCSEGRQRRLVRGVRAREARALALAEARHSQQHDPDWVSGACLLARRSALVAVAGFDEAFFLYEEDADFCRRVRATGSPVVFTPAAVVRHRLGRSMAQAPTRARAEYDRSHRLYYRKHNGLLQRLLLAAWTALRP